LFVLFAFTLMTGGRIAGSETCPPVEEYSGPSVDPTNGHCYDSIDIIAPFGLPGFRIDYANGHFVDRNPSDSGFFIPIGD